ncbi:hypothetical protein L3Q82_026236, partial [Scortum barcoo]
MVRTQAAAPEDRTEARGSDATPPNQKPWLNAEVRSLLKARDAAFRSGDSLALRAARRQLTAGLKRAKAAYAQRIQGHFTSNDPRSMWRGIKCITDYNTRDAQCPRDPSLPDALNNFYARFDDPNTSPSTRFTPPPGEEPLSVTAAEVRRTLQRINPRKAAGPDNISFYRCVVESVLSSCIIVWHGSCSAAEKKALQRVVKAAQRTVGRSLPTTTDIYTSRCRKRASCIMKDPTHTMHTHCLSPSPQAGGCGSIKSRTTRLRNSFFPEAVRLLNSGGP